MPQIPRTMPPQWLYDGFPLCWISADPPHSMHSNPHVRPVLIVTSSAATKSVNTASTSSSPAITLMISELGFGYFLGSTEARKAVIVLIGQSRLDQGGRRAHIEGMSICWSTSCFDACYRSRKELSRLILQYNQTSVTQP